MAENRAKKSGLGADIEKKLEYRYDQEEAAGTMSAIVTWLNAVVQGEHEQIASPSFKDLHKSLRDGILLCKLVNKLLASAGKGKVSFKKNAGSPFIAMGNGEAFNKGAAEYGLAKEFAFQTTDLWEGRKGPFLNVINSIHSLGFLANTKGFQPTYTGKQTKVLDQD